jgi:hypothetical protein
MSTGTAILNQSATCITPDLELGLSEHKSVNDAVQIKRL